MYLGLKHLQCCEKLILSQLVKKLHGFYGSQMFISMFTRTCHWMLSLARWIQFILLQPISALSSVPVSHLPSSPFRFMK